MGTGARVLKTSNNNRTLRCPGSSSSSSSSKGLKWRAGAEVVVVVGGYADTFKRSRRGGCTLTLVME